MKPFECDVCEKKVSSRDAVVRWRADREKNSVETFQIVHDNPVCSFKGKKGYFNRELPLEYVFKYMPEFIAYINRFNVKQKQLKDFVHRIEKGRSYIRRFNIDKKEVKKLIIRLDGLDRG